MYGDDGLDELSVTSPSTVVEPALELARPGFGRLVGRRVVHSEPSIRSVT